MNKADSVSWKTLADEKEMEWKSILESRIDALEKECKEKDNQLMSEKTKFNELKEHFKYNLKLLEDRDKELEKYDVSYTELRMTISSKNAEISELKIHLDDLKNVIKREEKIRAELQANYQKRLKEKQAEVDAYKSSKDGEIQDERKDYEEFRRNLQLQLLNIQNELDTQKSELTIGFENALKKREHEFRVQFDDLNTKSLEHELKVKILEKELELTRDSSDKTAAAAEEAETSQRKLEKLIKKKEWELADVTAVKDSLIAELQIKLTSCESAMKKMQDDFQRKYTEMDKLARDKESVMERAKNGYLEREQALQAVIQELQSKLEDAQIRERQLTWSNQDLVKEKEIQNEKFQEELNDVKDRGNRHIAEMSRENVAHDLELGSALEELRKLKLELEQRKDDLQRYRNELQVAADREDKLEKTKAQLELDWQRRCEDIERQQYDKSEELIKKLTTARNEAQALVKERDRELHHKVLLIKSLHREQDQMRMLLKKHNISMENFVKFSLDESETEAEMNYVEDLQKQNAGLKEVIAQMRLQMESVGQDAQNMDAKSTFGSLSVLEEEIQELKQENREMKDKLKSSRRATNDRSQLSIIKDNEEVLSQVEGNTAMKSHIIALNSNIGTLRSEKVELAATAKKQQARIAYLESSLEELSKQPRQKQIQIDQLTYELNSCKNRYETQVSGLKNRVSELEFLLSEARREADEYHRASLERNEELVALGNQLSALKMEMAESSPSINFGAQELYIQQLQDELNQLRKRAMTIDASDMDNISSRFASLGDSSDSSDLKHKLRTAVERIVYLAKENQQLTESNNRLRAELKATIAEKKSPNLPIRSNSELYFEDNNKCNDMKAQNEDPRLIAAQDPKSISAQDPRSNPAKDPWSISAQDRLQQLEKLQYHLTRKELQFTHRFKVGAGVSSIKTSYSDFEDLPEKDSAESTIKNVMNHKNTAKIADMKAKTDSTTFKSTSHHVNPQMLGSFSSGGGDSIQKVWQMLEESSPSAGPSTPRSPHITVPAAGEHSDHLLGTKHIGRSDGGDSFYLEGQPAPTEMRTRREKSLQNDVITYAEKVKKLSRPKSKIRNYNVRDDTSKR